MKTMLTSNSLTHLIRSFGRREQAFVQSLISDTRDPFYNLPTELLICIFDFLHPYDVWSKRLICRRWNNVLSSDDFTRTALNRFETHDPTDSALDPETHASSSNMLALRHTLALRNGRPFSYVNYGDQFAFLPNARQVARKLQLKGKYIAYLRGNPETGEGNAVVVRDLVTGESTSLCGTAREKIMAIELSTDIIAFFTYVGTVYVASLLNLSDPLRSVRLPSSTIYSAYADRGTLACLLGGASGVTVFIHDTETRKSTSFTHPKSACCGESEAVHSFAMLVNSHDKVIDIFSLVNSKNELKLDIKVVRYSLTGEHKAHECLTIWHGIERFQHLSLSQASPTGERGLYQLKLNSEIVSSPKTLCGTILFDANFGPNTVTLKLVDKGLRNTMLWKDRRYRTESDRFIVETARRPARFDGLRSLRALSNEASPHPITEDEASQKMEEDERDLTQDGDRDKQLRASRLWRPSHLQSWIRVKQPDGRRRFDTTHGQDQPAILPEQQEPLISSEEAMRSTPFSPKHLSSQPCLYTIIAMNDTFAVGTCVKSSYIGVMCFDERVKPYGAGLTDLWAHANNPYWWWWSLDRNYKPVGPGLLPLNRPAFS
jgi:hypothetical protein